ncbi:MAG TPA: immunoglobulin-like domain-containing protein [Planococcus sp. (in: firmicutes)]|nr:immunoglobulin-like domain-containing protein [Planococcus sp. (in: firmicutes)]
MKKIIMLLSVLVLAACSNETSVTTLTDPSPDQELHSSEAGLSMSLAEDTYDKFPSLIEATITNESQQNYGFGEFYHIEVNKNNKWYIVTHSDAVFLNNQRFNDSGQLLAAGSEKQLTFFIDQIGVALIPGEYRVVKTFLSPKEPFFEIAIASPFSVE